MKKVLVLLFSVGLATQSNAQKSKQIDKSISFTAAFGSSEFSTSFAYEHIWKLGKKNKFGIGTGVRLTNYFGTDKHFTTAPAILTSGKTGPGVFFSEDIPQNIDSVFFKKAQTNSLNISINFDYSIHKKITLGFNIDAVGFTFGASQNGQYFANNNAPAVAVTAKPTGFNLLLISDNDLGSLNSELYAKYKFNKKWGAKLGFQFLFSEYTTTTEVQTTPGGDKNDRFRNKSGGISFGITRQF